MAEKKRPEDGRKQKDSGNSRASFKALQRILAYIWRYYKVLLVIVAACIVLSALITLVNTLFMRTLIDDYIMPLLTQPSPDYGPLAARLLRLAAILFVGVLASFAYNRIMVSVSQRTMKRLRIELFTRMESLPIRYFDTHTHGDIMSVYTNDVDTLRQLIGQSMVQVLNSAITLVSTFVSMIVLSIPLTIVSCVVVGLQIFITGKLSNRSAGYFMQQQKDLGAVNGYIEEMVSGQKVVKVFNHEEKCVEEFNKLNEQLKHSACEANKVANITMPVNTNLGNISYVLCAIAGGAIALSGGALSIGTLVSFLNLNKNFSMPISQISQQINMIVMAGAGADRLFQLYDEEAETDEGYVELVNAKEGPDGSVVPTEEKTDVWVWKHPHQADGSVSFQRVQGEIVFDGVDFGYNDEKLVLHDIRMYAKPGQKIAFVGSTGAGKTTITNLINRFYDIQDGKIRYDGINITKIKKPDIRKSLGMVLQDTHLFTGTVMDNIRYGRLDATDEECMEAARLANADGFIRRLPNGYQTQITGDGGSLSQGQRQLIAIARTAVADPPVLILDEATSSIDTRTESMVQKGMDALMEGRTSFVIAHRLSTVRNADCIMVLEQGRIIERGTHDELLAQKGKYYQLYTGNAIAS